MGSVPPVARCDPRRPKRGSHVITSPPDWTEVVPCSHEVSRAGRPVTGAARRCAHGHRTRPTPGHPPRRHRFMPSIARTRRKTASSAAMRTNTGPSRRSVRSRSTSDPSLRVSRTERPSSGLTARTRSSGIARGTHRPLAAAYPRGALTHHRSLAAAPDREDDLLILKIDVGYPTTGFEPRPGLHVAVRLIPPALASAIRRWRQTAHEPRQLIQADPGWWRSREAWAGRSV